jgi:hypothetical protein
MAGVKMTTVEKAERAEVERAKAEMGELRRAAVKKDEVIRAKVDKAEVKRAEVGKAEVKGPWLRGPRRGMQRRPRSRGLRKEKKVYGTGVERA